MESYDVVILGAGPAGLTAAVSASDSGAKVLIVEREKRTGGILKQCIHDGFGLIRFGEKLSGPEYAERYAAMVNERDIKVMTSTFALDIKRENNSTQSANSDDLCGTGKAQFIITLVNGDFGVFDVKAGSIILACGCRERTARQVFIQGTRPAGVYTAGCAQHLVNIEGCLPCKKCVILGSGDVGLIMARRLKLEGAEVLGVYEVKPTPSGLSRNIMQCLDDFKIPLYLSHTITRIYGDDRVEAVEISEVDENMKPVFGTSQIVECDGVILSVGLIPENEMAEKIGVSIDPATKGPFVDQYLMTNVPGVFCCGNALHVNDLVDYVSESGENAGKSAAEYCRLNFPKNTIPIHADFSKFLYVVPQNINVSRETKKMVMYFRSEAERKSTVVEVKCKDRVLAKKTYKSLRPIEMQRLEIDLEGYDAASGFVDVLMMEG